MPVTHCRIHGLTACTPVCKHIGDDYKSGAPLRESRRIRFADADCDFFPWNVRLCQKCLRDFSVPENSDIMPFEESLDKHPQLSSPNLFCGKCFDLRLKEDPAWDASSYGIEWKTCSTDFVPDGALREIHISGTTIEECQLVYDALRSPRYYAFDYFVDNEEQPRFPKSIKEVFETRKTASVRLSAVSDVRANWHFFDATEIELDFDPAEVKSQRSLDDLLHLVIIIGETLKKQVNLTYEGGENHPFIVYYPDSREFKYMAG